MNKNLYNTLQEGETYLHSEVSWTHWGLPVKLGRPKARRSEPIAPPEVSVHSDASQGTSDIPERAWAQFLFWEHFNYGYSSEPFWDAKNKQRSALHAHLERNSEVFQWLLMEVLLVKEQQQLKNTPVGKSKMMWLPFTNPDLNTEILIFTLL